MAGESGRIPSFRVGTCVRFDPRSVAQWPTKREPRKSNFLDTAFLGYNGLAVQLWKETTQCWVDMDDGKTVPEEVLLVTRAQAAVSTTVATRELEFIKKEDTVQQFMNTPPSVLAAESN